LGRFGHREWTTFEGMENPGAPGPGATGQGAQRWGAGLVGAGVVGGSNWSKLALVLVSSGSAIGMRGLGGFLPRVGGRGGVPFIGPALV